MSEEKCPVDHKSREAWLKQGCPVKHDKGCSSDDLGTPQSTPSTVTASLAKDREVSSIPRGDKGNWVYPSEEMFFNAMRRKNLDPDARDMKTIIPIHNAVNERAWHEILKWEEHQGADKCGGPKLTRFEGDASKLTPRARWNMFWGYGRPFDRHDWVIDRCGTTVEYVIDFYTGKPNPLVPEMPSFYLDARPKLNSIEGIRLRVCKFLGL